MFQFSLQASTRGRSFPKTFHPALGWRNSVHAFLLVRARGLNRSLQPQNRQAVAMETESHDVTIVLSYVPTVFENYTASFEIDKRRIELNMWDTSGSSYYDNVRPLAYPDSDAVLICFDISRPETLDSVLKKWQGETQEFCPNAKVVLVGCKLDMRTDLATLRELSKQRLIPVTHEQGTVLAKQVGAVSYVECSSRSSERSVRDVFHVATVASLGRGHRQLRRTDSRRGLQRSAQLAGRPDRGNGNGNGNEGEIHKDRAKSCNLM